MQPLPDDEDGNLGQLYFLELVDLPAEFVLVFLFLSPTGDIVACAL